MVSAPCWLRPQPVRSSGAMSLNGLVMVSAPCWLRPQPVRSSGAMSLNGLVMGLSLAGAIAPVERRHLAP